MPSVKDLAARLARRLGVTNARELTEPQKLCCPICDEPMSLQSASNDAWLGLEDTRVHSLSCAACGMKVDRVFHPVVGYYPGIVI